MQVASLFKHGCCMRENQGGRLVLLGFCHQPSLWFFEFSSSQGCIGDACILGSVETCRESTEMHLAINLHILLGGHKAQPAQQLVDLRHMHLILDK